MKATMIYHTPEYHKLVEAIARVCYQSYDKVGESSHNMIKAIMKKGHLSVASSGNMVFTLDEHEDKYDVTNTFAALATFKEINNFVRWTTPLSTSNSGRPNIISMNMLTLLDIYKNIEKYDFANDVLDKIIEEVEKVPYLKWFLDPTTEVPASESPYIAEPKLGHPVVLTQDYTALKALGLTDFELDIHSTITVDFITDRASGLQAWRHGDMTGGCELSQRYCDRSTAVIREMEGIEEHPDLSAYAEREGVTMEEAGEHYDAVVQSIRNQYQGAVDFYTDVYATLRELGVTSKRAKEIARSVLPNAMTTRIIQCRPLRQWKHFMDLRITSHAQPEIREDAESILYEMILSGVAM